MKKYIAIAIAAATLTSCNDFLDREPLDFGDKTAYFTSPEDFAMSCNYFYDYLPKNKSLYSGTYNVDNNSDNQISGNNSLFYEGEKKTVGKSDESEWNFSHLRAINFFINEAEAAIESGHAKETNPGQLNHYLGEGYFFRAYDYFRLLTNYGDVPILTEMLPDDSEVLIRSSKRNPRNEVARFILSDLDKAAELMLDKAPQSGRVYKDVALALKARVALFEATWEKYHAGTCFVPGNSKWVGAKSWPDFAWPAGSAEAEINFFLEQAIDAAKQVADRHPLDTDYKAMFTNYTSAFPDGGEVLLARYYNMSVVYHNVSAHLRVGGNTGATRALVNSFLMADGTPIYASADYKGDAESYYEFQGRDDRLLRSVAPCGSIINTVEKTPGVFANDTVYFYRPNLLGTGNQRSVTGYDIQKWMVDDGTAEGKIQVTQDRNTTALPIFRSAEARLVYMEAYYLRYGRLDDVASQYWRELRRRAKVDEDFNKTIAATDLSKENDLAIYSKGQLIDATLYNIRRERRCEFISEGMRLLDLKRWRSLDNMRDYQPEGINLWEKQWEIWGSSIKNATQVSQAGVSNYIHPLQASATNVVYGGYNFPKPHYLEPIPLEEFNLTGGYGSSIIYQNPGWPDQVDGTADYSYDCD